MNNLNELNRLFLQKKGKIILKNSDNSLINKMNNRFTASFLKNIESFGFVLDETLINTLKSMQLKSATEFHDNLVANLREITGFNAIKLPLYYNFPLEVMKKEDCEIYIDSIIYLLTDFNYTPSVKKDDRLRLLDNIDLKKISNGTNEEFIEVFKNIISSKSSISSLDKEIVCFVSDNILDGKFLGQNIESLFDVDIYHKEVLTFVASKFMKIDNFSKLLTKYFNTATDVLRLATAMSNGDVSLAENTVFKSFSRKERRFLLSLLENTFNIEENMYLYKNKWIRLGEILHPFEYPKYKKSVASFKKIRNGEKIATFNSRVEEAIKNSDLDLILSLLVKKPSEFARRLDFLIRTFNQDIVLNKFEEVANQVSTPILLKLVKYYSTRNNLNEYNVYIPKGNTSKFFIRENYLKELPSEVCDKLSDTCSMALMDIFSKKENLGNVYIDENLVNYCVPTSLRNTQKSLKIISRGSKIKLNTNKDFMRLFIYWKQELKTEAVDLDLSLLLFDKDFKCIDKIYFADLRGRSNENLAIHSGDIRKAYDGATEFIDVDLKELKENGIAYAVPSVYSYTNQPFESLIECFIGTMEREDLLSGEIFEPSTVLNKIDLCSNSKEYVPFIFDIQEDSLIWSDLNMTGSFANSVYGKGVSKQVILLKSILNMVNPNLYDLFSLHSLSRGSIVSSIEEADIIFTSNKDLVLDELSKMKKEKELQVSVDFKQVEELAKLLNIDISSCKPILKIKEPIIISQFDTDEILSKYF